MSRSKTFRPGHLDGLESRIALSTVAGAMVPTTAEHARLAEHHDFKVASDVTQGPERSFHEVHWHSDPVILRSTPMISTTTG